jgi:hypothetical protein
LTTTKIGEVCSADLDPENLLPEIRWDAPVIDGIRRILSSETAAFRVIGSDGAVVGRFDLRSVEHGDGSLF